MRRSPRWLALFSLFLVASCDFGNNSNVDVPHADPNVRVDCNAKGFRCGSSGDCCGTLTCDPQRKICSDGECTGEGTSCTQSSDCCGALTCQSGVCTEVACRTAGVPCSRASQCCGALSCNSGTCSAGGCNGQGQNCTRSTDCCGALVCDVAGFCRQ